MGKNFFKDKKNVYALVIVAILVLGGYYMYDYVWTPFEQRRDALTSELSAANAEKAKIDAQKHRVAQLEIEIAQLDKDFEKLKEMFPEEEKVPLRLQDLYSVLRSSGVQIQKFNPEGRSEREHYIENRYSIAVNSGYHMLGYLLAEIANFNYPTAVTNLRLNRYSGISAEIQKAETHGWTPITMSVTFNLTTYTSKKVGK